MADPPPLPDAGSALFSERVLVVRQKPELVDSIPLYAIFDQNDARVGSVADVGRRDLGEAMGLDRLTGQAPPGTNSPVGSLMAARREGPGTNSPVGRLMAAFKTVSSTVRQATYRLEVRDEVGVAVLVLTSAEFWEERSLITVARGDGVTIGTIRREDRLLRKSGYALEAGGQRVGTIVNDRGFEPHHHVVDPQEREVARIAPRRRGVTRALARVPLSFTVQISLPLPDPLHSLLLAGALTADTALERQRPSDTGTGG